MDELTPYDYTLFIDADVIMINKWKDKSKLTNCKVLILQ